MPLTDDVIEQQVRSYILETYLPGEHGQTLRNDSDLLNVLNSLQLMRLIIELESMFGISFDDEDMSPENLGNIERIAVYVKQKHG